ncbi:MAG: YczE/YyaS/YitT family protein [Pseudomonadota bacterium]
MAKRFAKLLLGVFLYAVGIVLTINANLGLAPWDVFHQGLSIRTGITMGQASIYVGFVFVILDSFLGEKLGWGTLLNIVLIGTFVDILMLNHLLPVFSGMVPRYLEMFAGMMVIGIASYYYISAGLGSGPRDGLMVALTKRTTKSVRFIRNCIELCALAIGFFLGGSVGLGTLIMALSTGYFVQFAFKLFKYNVKETKHRFIDEDIKYLYDRFYDRKEGNNEKISEPFDEGE